MIYIKTLIPAFVFILFMSPVFGQAEKEGYKTVADKVEKFYNDGRYDSLFNMFSAEMKNALPIATTTEFLAGMKASAGKIVKREFTGYEKGSYGSYKTTFERAVKSVNVSIDKNMLINGLFVKPYVELPKMERNTTKLRLPFEGEWNVFWGGDTKELNAHHENKAQKNAFDIFILDEKGNSYKSDGKTNEDYYAFGQPLLAPCDGEVVSVVDGIKDNKPEELNRMYVPGNSVIIKTSANEYLFFAHFKLHSIKVREGQKVKQGEVLGLCGNSGNSSEAHLHFHIQNTEDINVATGVKCFFDSLIVNGKPMTDYSPVKNDKIQNQGK